MISRLITFSILFLSPIFLVRILDIRSYGQYREFMVYAMLLFNFLGFAINSNLLYFIPKYPEKETKCVTQTALYMLTSSLMGIVLIYLGKSLILANIVGNLTA